MSNLDTTGMRRKPKMVIVIVVAILIAAGVTFGLTLNSKDGTEAAGTSSTPARTTASDSARDVSQFHLTTPDDQAISDYSMYIANNVAYNCQGGQNAYLTHEDIDKFRPCPNGVAHIRLEKGEPKLIHSAGAPVKIKDNVDFMNDMSPLVEYGWNIEVDKPRSRASFDDNGNMKTDIYVSLWYGHDEAIKPFMNYVRANDGKWSGSLNTNDKVFNVNARYDIVITWNDPRFDKGPAVMPFDWDCVPNWMYGQDNESC